MSTDNKEDEELDKMLEHYATCHLAAEFAEGHLATERADAKLKEARDAFRSRDQQIALDARQDVLHGPFVKSVDVGARIAELEYIDNLPKEHDVRLYIEIRLATLKQSQEEDK